MSICSNCPEKKECILKHQTLFDNYKNAKRFDSGLDIHCKKLRKLILGRGKTARLKKKTYPMDIYSIENKNTELNDFQLLLLGTIQQRSTNKNSRLIRKLILDDLFENFLTPRETQIIRMHLDRYNQTEIAEKIGVSQPRVNYMLNRILKKLRDFASEGYKSA
jgi:RNA polymerase sigma factor (sigma-70 family)